MRDASFTGRGTGEREEIKICYTDGTVVRVSRERVSVEIICAIESGRTYTIGAVRETTQVIRRRALRW